MSDLIVLAVEIESFWLSLKYNKLYITAKTLEHCIAENKVLEEKNRKLSLVFTNPTTTDLHRIIEIGLDKINFIINSEKTQIVDKNGYVLNRYQIESIQS